MGEVLPKPVAELIYAVRDRVRDIRKSYGSLARYGYPIFSSKEEIEAVIYAHRELDYSLLELSRILGLDKTTLYKMMKKFERGQAISYYSKDKGGLNGVTLTWSEVKADMEELLRPKAKRWLKDVTEASCVIEFMKNPVKIQKTGKHSIKYTRSQVRNTINRLNELVMYINNNKEKIRESLGTDVPSNPDLWDDEEAIFRVIRMWATDREHDEFKAMRLARETMQFLKRIPKFREWFKGRIGTVRNVIRPKESTLFYEHYLKLKKLATEGNNPELRAFWLIAGLHIEAGTREGWGSLKGTMERRIADGLKAPVKPDKVGQLDLDSDVVNSSLIGVKWDNAVFDPSGELLGFKVWEEKTKKWWELRVAWLDKELHEEWRRIYEWSVRHNIKSVVKGILHYHGIRISSVREFREWYSKWCHRLKDLLKLPWDITPHRLRSAHISILAELRIPMELVLSSSANTGFGVGWDDMTTATIFYLRFSKLLVQDYLTQAEKQKERIASELRA